MRAAYSIKNAVEDDAEAIAAIHLAAMNTNPLLHVQFPSSEGLRGLQRLLVQHAVREIQSPSQEIIAAYDSELGEVVGFAKWNWPIETQDVGLEAQDFNWPPGCCQQYLDLYGKKAGEAKKRALGDRRCCHLTFVCTKPSAQGQGVGSCLMKEVLARAQAKQLPVYLEGTTNAIAFYEKIGFRAVDRFHLMIPRRGQEEPTERYEELCMIWELEQGASSR